MFTQRGDGPTLGGVSRLGERLVLGERVAAEEASRPRGSTGSQLVHPLGQSRTLVLQRNRVPVLVDRAERLMQLDVGAVR